MSKEAPAIGIDLGTTYRCIAQPAKQPRAHATPPTLLLLLARLLGQERTC